MKNMTSLFKHKRTTLERIEKFISPIYFNDVNLRGQLYLETRPLSSVLHWAAPGRVGFFEMTQQLESPEKRQVHIGSTFGPTWSTHWFQIKIIIPDTWVGREVHLLWDAGCEAMVWNEKGVPLQGLTGENGHQKKANFIITKNAVLEELTQTYFIEMACNTRFGAGDGTMISPPNPEKYFTLSVAQVAVLNRDVYNLLIDLELLHDMAKYLPEDSERAYHALFCGNQMINKIQVGNRTSYEEALALSKSFFALKNGDTQHTIIAVGHCHIDCAWLWPYEETIRKCARSWATTVRLMEEYPDFYFACSQAQQFAWVKEHYPVLYEKIKDFARQGKFIPVGGTWVEMDGNLPSGESFIRQFLYGQQFFKDEFGAYCKEFWLPDTFGYSAQLPQIMKLSNISRFLTQKLSWNLVNKFPHHNFIWEGIDGSCVTVHFPPGDSYEMTVSVQEVLKTVRNLEDKGRVPMSMMLFGHGDGGGGPDQDMLERQKRLKDVDGLPRVKMGTPDEFFSYVEQNCLSNICRWVGELYLELHNGTYTTQAAMKSMNRKCEILMHDIELLYSIILASNDGKDKKVYPTEEITRLWKLLLLNQFHDVLPGSSIQQVHEDALKYFEEIKKCGQLLLKHALNSLFGEMSLDIPYPIFVINPLSWQRTELISAPLSKEKFTKSFNIQDPEIVLQEIVENGTVTTLIPVTIVPMGYQLVQNITVHPTPVSIVEVTSNNIIICNQHLQVAVNSYGNITSLKHMESGKDIIPPLKQGNVFCMYDDIPLYWDAWDVMDYHLETRGLAVKQITKPLRIAEKGPLRVVLEYAANIGERSVLMQKIIIDAVHPCVFFETSVDWRESHKFLKVEFYVDVHAHNATYDIQFGHIQRPTHFNTSWDTARFEVYAHKWMDISEHNWGVAFLNDSKYGHSVHGNCARISLLRAPKSPDKTADQGKHFFTYAIMPHTGTFQDAGVIQQAYQLNSPAHLFCGSIEKSKIDTCTSKLSNFLSIGSSSWFKVNNPEVVISNVKSAEKIKQCLVVRLYESYGGHVAVMLTSTLPVASATICNALEDIDENAEKVEWVNETVKLNFKPFQIVSLLLTLK